MSRCSFRTLHFVSAVFYSLSGFANLRGAETIWLYYAAQMLQALEVARQQSLGAHGKVIWHAKNVGRFVMSDSALITASGLSLLCSPLVQDANERSLLSALYVYPHVTLNFMPTPLYCYGFRPLEAIIGNFNWHPWNLPRTRRNPWSFKWATCQIRPEFCFTEFC